jgi:hypothetical protein
MLDKIPTPFARRTIGTSLRLRATFSACSDTTNPTRRRARQLRTRHELHRTLRVCRTGHLRQPSRRCSRPGPLLSGFRCCLCSLAPHCDQDTRSRLLVAVLLALPIHVHIFNLLLSQRSPARRARSSVLERYNPGLFDPLEEAGGGPRIQEDRRSTQSRAGTSVAWVRLLYLEFVLSLTFGWTLASSAARAENLQRTQLVSHGVCDRLESLRVLTQDRRKLSIQPTRGTIL